MTHPEHGETARADAPDTAGLAHQLSEFAREAQSAPDVPALLQRVVDTASAEIGGADHAGITVVSKRTFATAARTSPLVEDVDRVQNSLGEGPCVTSLRDAVTVRSDDLSTDTRWPRFAAEAVRLGIRSTLSFQLFVGADTLGALNLYSATAQGFDEQSETTGLLLAAHAAVAMISASTVLGLRTALESRDVIGQAKGILMERYKFNEPHAFQALMAVSQHTQLKLAKVAEHLTSTGELLGVTEGRGVPGQLSR